MSAILSLCFAKAHPIRLAMLSAQPTSTPSLYHTHRERKQFTTKNTKRRANKNRPNPHANAAAAMSGMIDKGNSWNAVQHPEN